jgi:hypothetical protein
MIKTKKRRKIESNISENDSPDNSKARTMLAIELIVMVMTKIEGYQSISQVLIAKSKLTKVS